MFNELYKSSFQSMMSVIPVMNLLHLELNDALNKSFDSIA